MAWSLERIIKDLKKLSAQGKKPDIFELKVKYGFLKNSEFFPLLESIRTARVGLARFIAGIFRRVNNPQDLAFTFGPCSCELCQED